MHPTLTQEPLLDFLERHEMRQTPGYPSCHMTSWSWSQHLSEGWKPAHLKGFQDRATQTTGHTDV